MLRRQYQLLRPSRFLNWYKNVFSQFLILDSMKNLDSCVANQATSKLFRFNVFCQERPRPTRIFIALDEILMSRCTSTAFTAYTKIFSVFLLPTHGNSISRYSMLFGVLLHVRRMECIHNTLILRSIDKHIESSYRLHNDVVGFAFHGARTVTTCLTYVYVLFI